MTREEHLVKARADLDIAKRRGDYLAQISIRSLIADLVKMSDVEYKAYIKVRKMYSTVSVVPVIKGV